MLRPARPEEAPALTALAMRSKAFWGYDTSFMAACVDELTVSPQAIRRNPTTVVEAGGRVIGFYMLEPAGEREVELTFLFVEPEAIGQGYGGRLMRHAKAVAASLGYAALVVQGDPNAESFYRAAGGRKVGDRPSASIPGRKTCPCFTYHWCPRSPRAAIDGTNEGKEMKRDLDKLMEERDLDAAVVAGHTYGNPSLIYMLNNAEVTQGTVIKKRGEEAVFVHSPIERDEARASGLRLVNQAQYDYRSILREKGDPLQATVELYRRIFDDLGIEGQVGFYGKMDRGAAYLLLRALDEGLEGVQVRGEFERDLLESARATKDAREVAEIREVGRLTVEVIESTLDFLRRHPVKDETLVTENGDPLTIGAVKRYINRLLAERRLEDPEGFIFAIGCDAGIPHSKGREGDAIRLGQTIVYDIFPRRPGGYFFDCTRTFCLEYAPPEVERMYGDVAACVQAVAETVEVGMPARELQQFTCDFFARRGYPTIGSDPQTEQGFVHSIGHGLGLAIHEEPFFTDVPSNTRILEPGHVFSDEPGLYYPERGFGIRIEDVLWIDEGGRVHNLTNLGQELVVKMA